MILFPSADALDPCAVRCAIVLPSTSAPSAAEQPQPRVGSTHAREGSVEVFMEVELEG